MDSPFANSQSPAGTGVISILYLGPDKGTGPHRAAALRRLGHKVLLVDPHAFLPPSPLFGLWAWKTGGWLLHDLVRARVLSRIADQRFDLVLVDGGDLVGPALVRELKRRFGTVINYNTDDPFGGRDGRRWNLYLQSVPFYNLIVVLRDCNVEEALARGAANVRRVYMSADEIAHSPRQINGDDQRTWGSEVGFVGTWMPERGPLMVRLLQLGVPLSIRGNRWERAAEWSILRAAWRGAGLENEDEYAKAIQCAKVNLGLLSKGNRDLTTTRSFEIPYLGGVLCAERTAEHCRFIAKMRRRFSGAVPKSAPSNVCDCLPMRRTANALL